MNKAPVLIVGLTAGLCTLAGLTGGCVRSDDGVSAAPSDLSRAGVPDDDALPSVSLPDLSRLAPSVQAQVRTRYAALERLQSVETPSPAPAALADAYAAVGLVLLAAEFYDVAAASYLHAQAAAPEDMRWPYYLGQLHMMAGDRAQAFEFFERTLELQPTDVPTLLWLGRAHLDRGQPEAAGALFDRALSLEPGSAAAVAGVGRAALATRDFPRATEYLERALAMDQQASSLRYPLAMAYRALGEFDTAAAHLAQRGDGEPTIIDPMMAAYHDVLRSGEALERRGLEALGDGRLDAAETAFREGLALEPDNPSLRHGLATALTMRGDVPGAVEQLEETVRQSPEFARAHFSLGSIDYLSGRYPAAVARFSTVLEYQPNYLEARILLAEALRVTGRPEEALPHYEQAVASDPRVPSGWIGGAHALLHLQRYQQAGAWLADARAVHPGRPELLQLDEVLATALEAQRDGR